jgi:oligosaccharide repeat unit polymerase
MQENSVIITRYITSGPIIALQILIVCVIISCGIWFPILGLSIESAIYCICVSFLVLFIWSLWSWYRENDSLFSFGGLILLAFAAFNGGQMMLEVFHLNKGVNLSSVMTVYRDGLLGDRFGEETLLKSTYLVLLGYASLYLGMLLARYRLRFRGRFNTAERGSIVSPDDLRWMGIILLSISIVPTVWLSFQWVGRALQEGYVAAVTEKGPTGLAALPAILTFLFTPAIFYLLMGNARHPAARIKIMLLFYLYIAMNLVGGKRSYAISTLLALLWLWHACIRPISLKSLIIGSLALVLIIPIVGITRSAEFSGRLDFLKAMWEAGATRIPQLIISCIAEMGWSLTTVAYTVELVPSVRPFDLGGTYLLALTTVIPNIFGEIHPAIAYGLPGDWLMQTVNPVAFEMGLGWGYSALAETYLNWGWYGVVLGSIVLGWLLGKIHYFSIRTPDMAGKVLVASLISLTMTFARGSLHVIVRPFLWYCLGPYLLVHGRALLRYRRERESNPRETIGLLNPAKGHKAAVPYELHT